MQYIEPRKYLIEFWRKDAAGKWHAAATRYANEIPGEHEWPASTRRYGGEMRVYEFATSRERSGFEQ